MAFERLGGRTLDYDPCRYGGSKLLFRGPARVLGGRYAAFLGGTDTYGKFIAEPFAALVEKSSGMACVNLGWPNAGVDVFLNDPGVLGMARGAETTVLQLPCAQNLTNRYYRVHPRRNDRFLGPSPLLRAVFDDVDFTEFHFTRHLVRHLGRHAPDRFAPICAELQKLWLRRMRKLIGLIGGPVILLWFSARSPQDEADFDAGSDVPGLVTRPMLEALRSSGAELVEVAVSDAARAEGTARMVFAQTEAVAAERLLGQMAHEEAAAALLPLITRRVAA